METEKLNTATEALINIYQSLQNKPWGESTIVEGFYHIGQIEQIENPAYHRPQAKAYTYWKQSFHDEFDTNVIFPIPLAPFYNNSSTGSDVAMNDLLGKLIYVRKLSCLLKDGKRIFSIDWIAGEEVETLFNPDIIFN